MAKKSKPEVKTQELDSKVLETASELQEQHPIVKEDTKEQESPAVPVRNPNNLSFHNLKQAKK